MALGSGAEGGGQQPLCEGCDIWASFVSWGIKPCVTMSTCILWCIYTAASWEISFNRLFVLLEPMTADFSWLLLALLSAPTPIHSLWHWRSAASGHQLLLYSCARLRVAAGAWQHPAVRAAAGYAAGRAPRSSSSCGLVISHPWVWTGLSIDKNQSTIFIPRMGENRNGGVHRCRSFVCPAANVPLVEACSATLSLSIFVVFFLCLSWFNFLTLI